MVIPILYSNKAPVSRQTMPKQIDQDTESLICSFLAEDSSVTGSGEKIFFPERTISVMPLSCCRDSIMTIYRKNAKNRARLTREGRVIHIPENFNGI